MPWIIGTGFRQRFESGRFAKNRILTACRKANAKVFKIGIDIDHTITAYPEVFAELAKAAKLGGGEVHIISSRSDDAPVREQTENELREVECYQYR